MLKLSVIVPVYNVAPYLRKCVESLLKQDLSAEEYEIIFVDDGSTDGSGELCDEFASSNELESERISELGKPVIRVIHQKNGGLSSARNTGLAAATGKYVEFVDSDDYLEPNVLGGLIAQCERENLDVLRFDYQNVRLVKRERISELESEQEYEVFEPNKYPHQVDRRTDVTDGETYLNERMGYACYAVMFLIKRNLIISDQHSVFSNQTDNRLTSIEDRRLKIEDCLFTEGIHFEDVDWTPRMLLAAKRVNSTPMVVYNYLVREGSITQTGTDETKKRKNIEDSMFVVVRMGRLFQAHPHCQWLRNMQSSIACGVLTHVARHFYSERKDYIRRMKEEQVFPLAIANQGKTYRRRAKMINLLGARGYSFFICNFLSRQASNDRQSRW